VSIIANLFSAYDFDELTDAIRPLHPMVENRRTSQQATPRFIGDVPSDVEIEGAALLALSR